jgi:hypothetical protein
MDGSCGLLNKQSLADDKGLATTLMFGCMAEIASSQNVLCCEILKKGLGIEGVLGNDLGDV